MKIRLIHMVSMLLLLFCITACAQKEPITETLAPNASENDSDMENAKEQTGAGQEGAKDVSWQADYSQLENQYAMALAANHIYGCYTRNGQVMLDEIRKEDMSVIDNFALPDVSSISGMAADQEGNVYLLENREESIGFWKIDADGGLQDFAEMELENTEEADDLFLKGIYTDQRGYVYVWCEMIVPRIEMIEGREAEVWYYADRVYVKDGQLQTAFFEEIADVSGTQVLNFQVGADSGPLFVVKDSEGVYLQEIDVDQKGRKEPVRLDKAADSFAADINSLENLVPTDDGFLYCQGNALFTYDFDTQKAEKILNLSTYGIYSSDILFLAKNEKGIEIIDNHGDMGCSEFVSFTLGKAQKETVTLGVTMTVQDLEEAVAEFNRFSSGYRVEIVDYFSQTGDYEEAYERLKLDVVTGKAPDIIEISGMDYRIFSGKGVLADLYDFMQEDAECSKDMLVQSVMAAYEDEGHLYGIAPSFLLHSMWGYGDVIGGKSGVTFGELFRILGDSGKDLNAIAGFSADEPVLTRLCCVSMDEFVDWENGTCDFDGDYFKEVLSFAKEYTGNYTGGTYSQRIRNREVVMSVGLISSVADYQIQKELYGTDVSFIGYPVEEGSGTAIAFRDSTVAINARKEQQAGAWEFVKFYLLQGYHGQGFPVVREQLSQAMEAAMTEDYAAGEEGGSERIPKGYFGDGSVQIPVYAAAQEDVDAVMELIENARNSMEIHPVIQNIIDEEAQGYFSGQVDLDRTVEKIQNRVSLLLQESL